MANDPDRERALKAVEWEIEHGHSYRVDCIDPPIRRQYNISDMSWTWRVTWLAFLPWIGDRFRELGMRYRIWRDRNLRNPYGDHE